MPVMDERAHLKSLMVALDVSLDRVPPIWVDHLSLHEVG
jgi:hypothetical protein